MRNRSSSFTSTPSVSSSSAQLESSCESQSPHLDCNSRCQGLDLLLKAILHLTGPLFCDIPFKQRRVVRRAKRALRFERMAISEANENSKIDEKELAIEVISKPKKRQKRVMAFPSKYQDSVLQPWKRTAREHRSLKIDG